MFLNYNYYFGMTPEEQLLDDERTSKNRKQIKKVLVTAGWFIIFSTAVPKPTNAAPVPGAEGFSISSPQPKKYGRLPIRHSNHPTTSSTPSSYPILFGAKKIDDPLNRCQNRPDEFIRNDKFDQLSRNPETGKTDEKSTIEAISVMQAEYKGLVHNPRRPNLKEGEPNLDFVIDGPKPYKYVDLKNPIDPKKFPNAKGKSESIEKMATRMGKKITQQKGSFDDVLHIVDLEMLPSEKKAEFSQKLIEAAGSPDHITFIN